MAMVRVRVKNQIWFPDSAFPENKSCLGEPGLKGRDYQTSDMIDRWSVVIITII